MSNQTSNSPTNLTNELDSSAETTNHLLDEPNSELPSAIRQHEEDSINPNLGFNSPTLEFPDELEDSTTRLKRIRDELAQQLRKTEDELIQQEIDELQNSLDRRHRRGSDHYADLAYDDRHMNYDVPQAPQSNSSMSSSLTTVPPLPIKEPKESMGLIDFQRVLTLDGKITGDIAEKFYQQSRQAEFNITWQQCIHDEALDYIRMRVKTSYTQLNISEAEAHSWDPQTLNHREMASLIYKLFGNTAKTETQVQIFNAINRYNFGWRIDNREVEEESYANLCKLVTDHYGALTTITSEVHETIAKLIYKKLPAHTEMHKLYTDKTKTDVHENGPDTITRALDRYLSVIQTVRNITEKAKAYRIDNDEFYSGPTLERPNKESSKDKLFPTGRMPRERNKYQSYPRCTTLTTVK